MHGCDNGDYDDQNYDHNHDVGDYILALNFSRLSGAQAVYPRR